MEISSVENRPMYQELFPTNFGKILVVRVYPVEGTYTIKDSEGRDIREENMPLPYMKQLKVVRQKIETWVDKKMQDYHAVIAQVDNSTSSPTTNPHSNMDSNTDSSDSSTDTSTDT